MSLFNLTKAIPLGLFDNYAYTDENLRLEKGDQVFLYTDGLTEAEDADNKLYGDNRLLSFVAKQIKLGPRDLIKEVSKDVANHVNGHSQSDDLTMMSIYYYGSKSK